MLDKAKRSTLKAVSVGVTSALLGVSGHALSQTGLAVQTHSSSDAELGKFRVYTQVSPITNDVEVVIKNVGDKSATITQLTPSETVTKRGRFDFSALMAEGDLTIDAGYSVTVPMIPHPVVIDASSSAQQRAQSLSQSLRTSLSIVTEHQSFAMVDIEPTVRFA